MNLVRDSVKGRPRTVVDEIHELGIIMKSLDLMEERRWFR